MSNERIQDDLNKKPYLDARTFDFICFNFLQAHTLQTLLRSFCLSYLPMPSPPLSHHPKISSSKNQALHRGNTDMKIAWVEYLCDSGTSVLCPSSTPVKP